MYTDRSNDDGRASADVRISPFDLNDDIITQRMGKAEIRITNAIMIYMKILDMTFLIFSSSVYGFIHLHQLVDDKQDDDAEDEHDHTDGICETVAVVHDRTYQHH